MNTNDLANTDNKKKLEKVLGEIEKKYGKGAVMVLGDSPKQEFNVIPTGAINLDYALGIGGLPRGRIIEIYGPESSGKTTLALHCIAEAQKLGGKAAFIDAEHALDVQYAKRLGVNTDDIILSQPDYGEQALGIVESLVSSNAIDLIVVDSVAALVPRAEIEGDMGDSHMGLLARLMSQALRKLTGVVSKSNTCVIFLNQIRQKIGIVYGNPETTTGGIALKFASTIRMEIRRGEAIREKEEIIGNKTKVKVVKNKVAPPFKNVEFDIMYGTGISRNGTILDLATTLNIVDKAGSWYSYKGEKLGQGKERVKTYFEENPDVLNEIETTIREQIKAQNNGSEKIEETE